LRRRARSSSRSMSSDFKALHAVTLARVYAQINDGQPFT
jgi:hypothetical protein